MKKFLFIIAISAFFLIGCQSHENHSDHSHENAKPQNSPTNVTEKSAEDFSIDFKTSPAEVKADEQTNLLFTVKNAKGETVKDLQIVHEKPMHLLVVSEDLAEFYHLHPELQSDGSFKVPFAFKNGGKFKLYTDFTPKDARQNVKVSDLTVAGNPRPAEELKIDEKFEKTVEDLQVIMKPDTSLETGKDVMLNFTVLDSRTKQPVTDLQKYLGELAHFVIINKDLTEFVHAHPMSKDNVKDGEHSHGDENRMSPAGDAIVSAHVSFPKAGIYKIWAQFQRNGKVTDVPFVIDVKQGKESAPVSEAKIPDGAFKITVSKDGFTPSNITYKKDTPLKLAFHRTDAENCGSEVVFKTLNITKKLPVGEVVTIDIPTDKEGEFSFACGMNMYKGKIIVQ